jgi:hypothetical protein
MNGDLKLRLKPFLKLDFDESMFWGRLLDQLGTEALTGLENGGHIVYCFGPIDNGEDDTGYVTGDGYEFELALDSRMPFGMVVDYLIHELAHIHSWERADDAEDHCDEFGKSYALLHRLYIELYEEYWCA